MKKILIVCLSVGLFGCGNSDKKKSEAIKIGGDDSRKTQTSLEKSMERGGAVYTDFCMQCHMANGKGIPGNFPPLAGSNWLTEKRTESIHSVKFGQSGEIVVNGVTYDGIMAPMGLSDEEIADVMNYIMNSWGNTQDKMVTPQEVKAVEK
jgi:mono/diheme cytochrome c family protein